MPRADCRRACCHCGKRRKTNANPLQKETSPCRSHAENAPTDGAAGFDLTAVDMERRKISERHLWPAFAFIAECKPPVVFGEQVESAIKHGWIDDLQADLEREDYAVGFAVLGAHSLGAPHIRQRLYWVANAELHGHPAAENRGSIRKKQEEGGCCNLREHVMLTGWPTPAPGLERFSGDGDRIYAQGREHKIEAESGCRGLRI